MTKLCVAGSQHPFGLSASLLAQDWKIPVAQSHLADLPSVETVSKSLDKQLPGLFAFTYQWRNWQRVGLQNRRL